VIRLLLSAALAVAILVISSPSRAAAPDEKDIKDIRDKAIAFLKKRQSADGGFSTKFGPGITALVVAALLRNGVEPDDPVVEKALASLTKTVKPDGGIYAKGLANYTTAVGIMALQEANKGGKYDKIIKNATAFLQKLQKEDVGTKDIRFGGVGYDAKSRPDLSNTQFFIDALIRQGCPRTIPPLRMR